MTVMIRVVIRVMLSWTTKAIQMFQAAIDLDPRQYNAWWGLGDVFQRQEDFVQAKYNFLRALDINPSNQERLFLCLFFSCFYFFFCGFSFPSEVPPSVLGNLSDLA